MKTITSKSTYATVALASALALTLLFFFSAKSNPAAASGFSSAQSYFGSSSSSYSPSTYGYSQPSSVPLNPRNPFFTVDGQYSPLALNPYVPGSLNHGICDPLEPTAPYYLQYCTPNMPHAKHDSQKYGHSYSQPSAGAYSNVHSYSSAQSYSSAYSGSYSPLTYGHSQPSSVPLHPKNPFFTIDGQYSPLAFNPYQPGSLNYGICDPLEPTAPYYLQYCTPNMRY